MLITISSLVPCSPPHLSNLATKDLIVDLPSAPGNRGDPLLHHTGSATDDTDSSATLEASNFNPMMKQAKVRSVSFSDVRKVALVPSKSDQDVSSAWYSKEDQINQMRMVLRDAAEVSRVLETGQALNHEDLCKTVGIENFMAPRLMRMSKIEIQRHAHSIVLEQTSFDDPALLSRLSKRSSLHSRQRA